MFGVGGDSGSSMARASVHTVVVVVVDVQISRLVHSHVTNS
jgi:hypothetical protein